MTTTDQVIEQEIINHLIGRDMLFSKVYEMMKMRAPISPNDRDYFNETMQEYKSFASTLIEKERERFREIAKEATQKQINLLKKDYDKRSKTGYCEEMSCDVHAIANIRSVLSNIEKVI